MDITVCTVSNRSATVTVDMDTTFDVLRRTVAEALGLDEATVVLSVRGKALDAAACVDATTGERSVPVLTAFQSHLAAAGPVTVMGIPKRVSSSARSVGSPRRDGAAGSPKKTPAQAALRDGWLLGRPHSPDGLAELATRLKNCNGSNDARRQVYSDHCTMAHISTLVREAPTARGMTSERALECVLQQAAVECPAFVEQVRAHPKSFLDAVNGVVARMTIASMLTQGLQSAGAFDIDIPGDSVDVNMAETLLAAALFEVAASLANGANSGNSSSGGVNVPLAVDDSTTSSSEGATPLPRDATRTPPHGSAGDLPPEMGDDDDDASDHVVPSMEEEAARTAALGDHHTASVLYLSLLHDTVGSLNDKQGAAKVAAVMAAGGPDEVDSPAAPNRDSGAASPATLASDASRFAVAACRHAALAVKVSLEKAQADYRQRNGLPASSAASPSSTARQQQQQQHQEGSSGRSGSPHMQRYDALLRESAMLEAQDLSIVAMMALSAAAQHYGCASGGWPGGDAARAVAVTLWLEALTEATDALLILADAAGPMQSAQNSAMRFASTALPLAISSRMTTEQALTVAVPVDVAPFESTVSQALRVCRENHTTCVYYTPTLPFSYDVGQLTGPPLFQSLGEFVDARLPGHSSLSLAAVLNTDGTIETRPVRGAVSQALSAMGRIRAAVAKRSVGLNADVAARDALAELSQVLLVPVLPNLQQAMDGASAASAAAAAAPASSTARPLVAFVPSFADVPVPFHALPMPTAGRSPVTEAAAHTARPLVACIAATQTPTLAAFSSAAERDEAVLIKSRVVRRGVAGIAPGRRRRGRGLPPQVRDVLNITDDVASPTAPAPASSSGGNKAKQQQPQQQHWTLLCDDAPPTRCGCDFFYNIGSTANAGAVADSVQLLFAREGTSARCAVTPAWAVPFDGSHDAAADSASRSPHRDTDDHDDEDDVDASMSTTATVEDPAARALIDTVFRRMYERLAAPGAPPLAALFAEALEATVAEQNTPLHVWASLTMLHYGGHMRHLRSRAARYRREQSERARGATTRLTSVRGPLSAAESRNVQYVQRHDVPALLDAMCQDLLVERPEGTDGVIDTLIASLERIEAERNGGAAGAGNSPSKDAVRRP